MFTLTFFYQQYAFNVRRYTTKINSPMKVLDQLYRLSVEANQTQSVNEKRQILKQYPNCQAILKRIYDPHRRHFVSSKAVSAYMIKQKLKQESNSDYGQSSVEDDHLQGSSSFTSLEALLDALSSRQLTGHTALDAIGAFYTQYCTNSTQQLMFWRVLDRDLKMGVSVQTIRRLLTNNNNGTLTKNSHSPSAMAQAQQKLYDRRFMKVSLAATMRASDEMKLWQDICKTGPIYVSRKLDGVRCITLIQYIDNQKSPHITFCSRTGRVFDSLGKVEDAIRQQLDDQGFTNKGYGDMVLDGEICVYPPSSCILDGDDGNDEQDRRKEDFLTTMRQIRTIKKQMDNPVYQIFDLIGLDVFRQGKGGPLFNDRQQQLEGFMQSYKGKYLEVVQQNQVSTKDQLIALKKKVAQFGWEGLIVRKNVEYEGKRSRNMLKIKEWEDAEYIVQRIETGTMRMPDTGQQKRVMTNVIINHKGNDVGVGSGFTLQSRLDYANHPDLILGKLITVQYFSESLGDSGILSLRFPSVKAVYENGRD